MKFLYGSNSLSVLAKGVVATVGNFDGVHLGHRALLSRLKSEADERQLPLLVILFEPQPSEYFLGDKAPPRLSSLREKLTLLAECNVDYVYCLRFNASLLTMSATDFAERYFFSLLQVRYLLIGEDFRFGYNRSGDVSLLKALASNRACQVESFSDFKINGVRISSTDIRKSLERGDLKQAEHMLGRPFYMCGRVAYGAGLGRKWGIPTANLAIRRLTLPLRGVFCVQVKRANGQILSGVANVGTRPTVDGKKQVLEVHLLEFDQSVYGERLQVAFLHKLRDEVRFDSVDKLIEQIRDDIRNTCAWFAPLKALQVFENSSPK